MSGTFLQTVKLLWVMKLWESLLFLWVKPISKCRCPMICTPLLLKSHILLYSIFLINNKILYSYGIHNRGSLGLQPHFNLISSLLENCNWISVITSDLHCIGLWLHLLRSYNKKLWLYNEQYINVEYVANHEVNSHSWNTTYKIYLQSNGLSVSESTFVYKFILFCVYCIVRQIP